jgi:HEAT repeats/HEAT repeat/PBS lyase HEAT-like repeat
MPFTAALPRLPRGAWERVDRVLGTLDECMSDAPTHVARIENDQAYVRRLTDVLRETCALIEEVSLKNEVIDPHSWPTESQADAWSRGLLRQGFEPALSVEDVVAWLGQTNGEGQQPGGDPKFFVLMTSCLADFSAVFRERTRPADRPQTVARVGPLFTDALDRVVVVEDKSDENQLLLWMEKVLPADQWETLSIRRFCLTSEKRPTGDGVKARLMTIKQIHPEERNLQPEAFVLADRDYRIYEELQVEARKLKGKAFVHQTWHVWERVEIENYLLCPSAIVRFVLERSYVRSKGSAGRSCADEREVRALLDTCIESSREAARAQLIDSFERVNRAERKGWQTSTVVRKAEEFLDSVWHGDERLVWCDVKEIALPRLREEVRNRWNLSLTHRDLIRCLNPDELPQEILDTVHAIASFLSKARWAERPRQARVRALFEALRNKNTAIRRQAAEELGREDETAVPGLVRALQDDDAGVRLAAAEALGAFGDGAAAAVDSLIDGVGDLDPQVREMSIRALGNVGSKARLALPVLIKALASKDWRTSLAVTEALGKIGASEAIPALLEVLRDKDVPARDGAALALGEVGPSAAKAVPDLLLAIREDDRAVRAAAATALGKIGVTEAKVCAGLKNALKDEDESVRNAAREAMGRLGFSMGVQ